MTKLLTELLAAREPDFHFGIEKLERASGRHGQDIKLSAELSRNTASKLRELGLSPTDTTAQELYRSLDNKIVKSDKAVCRALRLEPLEPTFMDDLASRFNQLIDGNCLAIKPSVARRLFRQQPPNAALKKLGFRSADSFFKHESLASIAVAAKIYQSVGWWSRFRKLYSKLRTDDLEVRQLEVTALDGAGWQKVAREFAARSHTNLVDIPEMGVISLLPVDQVGSGMTSALFMLLVDSANKIRSTSSYLSLYRARADIGEHVARVSRGQAQIDLEGVGDFQLSWHTIHRYLSGQKLDLDLIDPVGFRLDSPAELLANLHPALGFWSGCDSLAHLAGGRVVSINPLDVAINHLNKLSFGAGSLERFRHQLWQRFWTSYLELGSLGEQLKVGLERELAAPQPVPQFADFD